MEISSIPVSVSMVQAICEAIDLVTLIRNIHGDMEAGPVDW